RTNSCAQFGVGAGIVVKRIVGILNRVQNTSNGSGGTIQYINRLITGERTACRLKEVSFIDLGLSKHAQTKYSASRRQANLQPVISHVRSNGEFNLVFTRQKVHNIRNSHRRSYLVASSVAVSLSSINRLNGDIIQ